MPSITVQSFAGMVPRTSPRLLANGDAINATMVKLWSGELRPFLKLGEIPNVPLPSDAPVKTLYLLLDKWLAWTQDVNVVTGFTTTAGPGRIYYTGDGAPKQTTYDLVRFGPATPLPASTYPIGLTGPPGNPATDRPVVTDTGSATTDPVAYSYIYTYYNVNNEESVPSLPSAIVTINTTGGSQQATISNIIPSASPLVTEMRVYRTIGNTYIFVASIPPTSTSYVDNNTDLDLAGNESLQSQEYYPPPADIQGLIGLACGSLAAFHGNSVVFSEPYQPGAWPPAYEKIFDYPVVALGTFGQTCVVATTGYTYLVYGNDPRTFGVSRVPDPYPCVSKRSMVSADNGVIYASADGLIFIGTPTYTNPQGVHILTRELMTTDEWAAYNPPFISGVIFDGRYYGFYEYQIITPQNIGAGFIIDFSARLEYYVSGVASEAPQDRKNILLDLDFYASAAFANPQVKLHLVINTRFANNIEDEDADDPAESFDGPVWNELFKWEGGTTYHPLTWRSKQFSFPYAVSFSVVKVLAPTYDGSITFSLLDGVSGNVLYTRMVQSEAPFRLPSIGPRTEWGFEIEADVPVQMVDIATSYQDLQERKGT